MPITIGANITSLRTQRQIGQTTDQLARVYERLSSGQRINRASDDAAGLAIASQLNSDSRVLSQAIKNVNDGISVANVAEGALNTLKDISLRQLELAEQAANGTYSHAQRGSLNSEANKLVDEFNRIVSSVTFNGINIFDPSGGSTVIQAGVGVNGTLSLNLNSDLKRAIGDGSFSSPTSYNIGSSAYATELVDINGDGKLDIVAANYDIGGITVLLGNGDATFGVAKSYISEASDVRTVEIGDFNGDGIADIATSSYFTGDIFVALGNGDGTFQHATSFNANASNFGYDLESGDFNGDGKLDFISSDYGGSVYVSIGRGDGTFTRGVSLNIGVLPTGAISVADFDNNGTLDFMVAKANHGQTITYLGNGNGTFAAGITSLSGAYVGDIGVADFNGDGLLDIVTANGGVSGPTTTVNLGNGNGTFRVGISIPLGATGGAMNLRVQDLNKDGRADIVVTNQSNKLFSIMGNGDGTFQSPITLSTVGQAIGTNALAIGDINGDGRYDLTVSSIQGGTRIVTYLGNGGYTSTASYLNLNTQEGARAALDTANQNLNRILTQLGAIGATTSRFSSALNTLQATRENYLAAASRIKDADIAAESSELVRKQILQQTTSAVLAQANQQPALALKLLRGG